MPHHPLFLINFKTYEKASGKNAYALARICDEVANKKRKKIVACLSATDLSYAQKLSLPVFAQHVDPYEEGAHTGFILPSTVFKAGCVGTLLNHSEHKLSISVLVQTINLAQKEGLIVVVCADTPQEAAKIATLHPDYIAIEPPELIGRKISVATAKPEIITKTIKAVSSYKIPVLCGAGVHEQNDVRIALNLGCVGVLVASGVVLAKNPKKVLEDLTNV